MKLKMIAAALLAVIGIALPPQTSTLAASSTAPINTIGTDGVAIKGYDPVAYFTKGAPKKGKPEFAVQHRGATFHFANAEHQKLFQAEPEKYTPIYGGYCAYGVAQGYLVKIEPDAWAILDGKLYLNYDRSVQKTWSEKPAHYIKEADQKWPGLAANKK